MSNENKNTKTYKIDWPKYKPLDEWLKGQPTETWKETFEKDGYLVVHGLIDKDFVEIYKDVYMKLLNGEIDTRRHRQDLGCNEPQKTQVENICQIMWPHLYVPSLMEGPLSERVQAINKIIIGPDAAFDFNMLISKVALDQSTVDNGCMWFVPGSHKLPLRKHWPASKGAHVLQCECTEGLDETKRDDVVIIRREVNN
ncbi:predicted protein [Nematostella vectensis]|uniref:Uncharacterized protein n=1 Tax=Nematostella vectensis TaxID=45351 RepID=A7RJD8_NEMVE|nr:predicted protein [Nematostella vectensis]|eukprot:XP_001640310.1 predicted protein [Nematostella vectensis]